jgi:hypothetical protein
MNVFFCFFIILILVTFFWLRSFYVLISDKKFSFNANLCYFILLTVIRETQIYLLCSNDCTSDLYIKSILPSGCHCEIAGGFEWLGIVLLLDLFLKIILAIFAFVLVILYLWKNNSRKKMMQIILLYFLMLFVLHALYPSIFFVLDHKYVFDWNLFDIYQCSDKTNFLITK